MRNEKIGIALKEFRKANALSVKDVAVILSEKYNRKVAIKTIYGWESSQSTPTTDMFLILCDIYKIAWINDIYGKPHLEFTITKEEKLLIESYRKYPELHHAIHKLLEI